MFVLFLLKKQRFKNLHFNNFKDSNGVSDASVGSVTHPIEIPKAPMKQLKEEECILGKMQKIY